MRPPHFLWDPVKAALNLHKHGVDFADAVAVLEDTLAITMADPDADGEERRLALGTDGCGRFLVVVFAERGPAIRIISARRATRGERRNYEAGR